MPVTQRKLDTSHTPTAGSLHIRWMRRIDLPAVLAIEFDSFEFPWTEDEFSRVLRQRNCIGMVAVLLGTNGVADRVVRFMVYDLEADHIVLRNFAVAADMRRRGVGSALIAKLRGKVSLVRRTRLVMNLIETNTRGHLFLRSNGFKATAVLKGESDWTDADEYRFEFRHTEEAAT